MTLKKRNEIRLDEVTKGALRYKDEDGGVKMEKTKRDTLGSVMCGHVCLEFDLHELTPSVRRALEAAHSRIPQGGTDFEP